MIFFSKMKIFSFKNAFQSDAYRLPVNRIGGGGGGEGGVSCQGWGGGCLTRGDGVSGQGEDGQTLPSGQNDTRL